MIPNNLKPTDTITMHMADIITVPDITIIIPARRPLDSGDGLRLPSSWWH
jgi:hypothetical protein